MKPKEMFALTGIPVFIASLCCLAPVVLVALGITTVAAGASLTNVLDGQYRWAFNLVAVISLMVSIAYYFRRKGVCTLDQVKKHRNEIINKTLLVIIIGYVSYYLFFNVFLTYVGHLLKIW